MPAWDVSDPFPEAALDGRPELDGAPSPASPGHASRPSRRASPNLARAHGVRDGADTVLARTSIRSDGRRTKRLRLGFSDRVRAYLNGRLLFAADDTYRSRDYRFLGSIGWWDSLWLQLEDGDNELVLAVSETFGGWGVQARFDDLDGIRLEP